jgi:hypothetical protein
MWTYAGCMNRTALLLSGVTIFVAGCDDTTSQPAPPAVAAPAAEAPKPKVPEYKPEYTVEVKTNAAGHKIVVWTAKVNTGGWKLITDSVLVETPMDKMQARVWSTLEQPGPDEMVTQGFETVTAEYDAGDKNVEEAELSIRRMVRGVKSPWAPLYEIVKRWP